MLVTRIVRKLNSGHTSCPCRAEVNFTRRVCGFTGMNLSLVPVKTSLSANSAPLREEEFCDFGYPRLRGVDYWLLFAHCNLVIGICIMNLVDKESGNEL